MSRSLGEALDRVEAGDWDGAHDVVAADGSREAAWLHAHLHRVEGDAANAAYWYRRAGRAAFEGTPEEERAALRDAL